MIALKASGYCACRCNWITTRRLKHRECNSPLKIIDLVASVRLPISSPCITSLANLFFAAAIWLVNNSSSCEQKPISDTTPLVPRSYSGYERLSFASPELCIVAGFRRLWPALALIVQLGCKMSCSLSASRISNTCVSERPLTHLKSFAL